jgi:hypothetical protein
MRKEITRIVQWRSNDLQFRLPPKHSKVALLPLAYELLQSRYHGITSQHVSPDKWPFGFLIHPFLSFLQPSSQSLASCSFSFDRLVASNARHNPPYLLWGPFSSSTPIKSRNRRGRIESRLRDLCKSAMRRWPRPIPRDGVAVVKLPLTDSWQSLHKTNAIRHGPRHYGSQFFWMLNLESA